MAKEPMNQLRTFFKPISSTIWCVLLVVISVIILLVTPHDKDYFEVVLACTTGVSASAVVTFFAERANRKKQKHFIAVRLADFHKDIDSCCPKNVSDERRKEVVTEAQYWSAVFTELEKFKPCYHSPKDSQEEYEIRKELYRENCILSMVILTKELDRLRDAFNDVDISCLTERELKWVTGARKCFRDLVDCVADDIPVKEKDQIIRMDTRLHAMQKYLSLRQEESQKDIVHALVDKNLQDILFNHPNLLSDVAAVKAMDLGCTIMAYVGCLDDEFIRSFYIESERRPDPAYDYYVKSYIQKAV